MDPDCTPWTTLSAKVVEHATERCRMKDRGGAVLLMTLGECLRPAFEQALATARWRFLPLEANFDFKGKLQTRSSLLDRLLVQAVLAEPGWRIQQEVINANCDDDLMPLPPAFRYRPPDAPGTFSPWWQDYRLWKDAQRLYAMRGYRWMVACDIRNFFYTVPQADTASLVAAYVPTESHRRLLVRRMRYPVRHEGDVRPLAAGLPVCEPESQLFANAYLAAFDAWAVNWLCVPHVRYVDDCRFFARSESEAKQILRAVREAVQLRFGLLLNAEKSEVRELWGSPDSIGARDLLSAMKRSIREPLDPQHAYGIRRVPADTVLDAWNTAHRAMLSGNADSPQLLEALDLLASLRATNASRLRLASLVGAILDRTLGAAEADAGVRHTLATLAMRHLRSADRDAAQHRLPALLDHPDERLATAAFNNLVACHTDAARDQAEAFLLRSDPHHDATVARLDAFVLAYGGTPALRNHFATAGGEARSLVSAPFADSVDTPADIVRDLADACPRMRRDAALRLPAMSDIPVTVRRAWADALRVETDRDARLALLAASAAFAAAAGKVPMAQPQRDALSPLERTVLAAVEEGRLTPQDLALGRDLRRRSPPCDADVPAATPSGDRDATPGEPGGYHSANLS